MTWLRDNNTRCGAEENQELICECCKCGDRHKESDRAKRRSKKLADLNVRGGTLICPNCGHDEFYSA